MAEELDGFASGDERPEPGPRDATADGDGAARGDVAADPAPGAGVAARAARLEAENARLREKYERLAGGRYRRSIGVFVGLAVLAVAGAAVVPDQRSVLLALAGLAAFAAALAAGLTPERFLTEAVGDSVYDAVAADRAAAVAELDLAGDPWYVPTGGGATGVRYFRPQERGGGPPSAEAVAAAFVVEDHRGVAFEPTGAGLVAAFESETGGLPEAPAEAAAVLADAVREQYELAANVSADVTEGDRAVVEVTDPRVGDPARPDHPIQSVVGVGLATALDRPVRLEEAASATEGDDGTVLAYRFDRPEA